MKRVPLADLSVLTLEGERVLLSDLIRRTTLVIFLRHLA